MTVQFYEKVSVISVDGSEILHRVDIEHIPILHRLSYVFKISYATGEFFDRFPKHQCFIPQKPTVPCPQWVTLRCILFAPPPVFGLTPLVRMSSVAGCFRNFTKGMDGTIHWTENKQPAMPTCNRSTLISFYILVQPKKKENSTDTRKHPV